MTKPNDKHSDDTETSDVPVPGIIPLDELELDSVRGGATYGHCEPDW